MLYIVRVKLGSFQTLPCTSAGKAPEPSWQALLGTARTLADDADAVDYGHDADGDDDGVGDDGDDDDDDNAAKAVDNLALQQRKSEENEWLSCGEVFG